ncbi:MAG: AIR synthase-related protein [Thermodesulfobacteriota bacterium]
MAVPEEKAEKMVRRLKERGIEEATIIGEVVNDSRERIAIKLDH